MPPTTVRQHLALRPFRPFRLTLTDGRNYEVRHPELVIVGRDDMVVGFPAAEFDEPVYDRFVMISLPQIKHIETLQDAAPAKQ